MKINPRLYQAMELLYMPLLDLQQHLKQEMAENPFLEMGEADVDGEVQLEEEKKEKEEDEIDWEEILLDGFDAGGRKQQYEEKEYYEPTPVETHNLQDHLMKQLQHLKLSEREMRMGEEIIGNVDDDGSLSCDLELVVEGVNMWLDEVRNVATSAPGSFRTTRRPRSWPRSGSSSAPTTWRRRRPC
jgi:RNA polymerase sigma-54 factor